MFIFQNPCLILCSVMYYGRARGAPRTFVCMAFSVLRIVLFTRCEWGHLPGYHDSLFIIHHTLFTDIKIINMLSAGFSIGRNNAKEAAISGVCLANWESFANRPRRETAVGLPTLGNVSKFGGRKLASMLKMGLTACQGCGIML